MSGPVGWFFFVMGAALLPWAPSPLVGFGDISYGSYLLHWPMLGLAAWWINGAHPNEFQGEFWRWEIFLHIAALAYVSWIYLEAPMKPKIDHEDHAKNTRAGELGQCAMYHEDRSITSAKWKASGKLVL